MAVIALYGFRTAPGKLVDHLAATAEGLGHLRRLGLQAVNLEAIAGSDVGVIATSVNHASKADYAAACRRCWPTSSGRSSWCGSIPTLRPSRSRARCSSTSTPRSSPARIGRSGLSWPRSSGRGRGG